MYLDVTEKDPNRNRKTGLVIFIICVIYIAAIVKCSGQNKNNYLFGQPKNSTRITTSWSVTFGVFSPKGTSDTIFLGICVDSISTNKIERYVFVYYPKDIKIVSPKIDIGLDKGGIITLDYNRIFPPSNFVNYLLTNEQYEGLKNSKFDYINFRIDDYEIPYVLDESAEYFVKFFASI